MNKIGDSILSLTTIRETGKGHNLNVNCLAVANTNSGKENGGTMMPTN